MNILGIIMTSKSGDFAERGNVKTLNKLDAEVYDDFIEFDFNVPAEIKGQGISSVVFDDAIKYYDAKNISYKGIRGKWQDADPKYTDGISDNFKHLEKLEKQIKHTHRQYLKLGQVSRLIKLGLQKQMLQPKIIY